jgi:hypothetical protein
MEPARKLDPPYRDAEPTVGQSGRKIEEWETKLGKTIFYLTVAASLWFFYWLNGIQCPC